jgi:hypothetical protein
VKPRTWTIFDSTTRMPVECVTCRAEDLDKHIKEGLCAVDGRHRGAVRLNDAGEVEVDEGREEAVRLAQRRNARQARVEELERLLSRRAERELLLAIAEHVGLESLDAYVRLKAIDSEVEALRQEFRATI